MNPIIIISIIAAMAGALSSVVTFWLQRRRSHYTQAVISATLGGAFSKGYHHDVVREEIPFDHDGKMYAVVIVRTSEGYSVGAELDGKAVNPWKYTVSHETEHDLQAAQDMSALRELVQMAISDVRENRWGELKKIQKVQRTSTLGEIEEVYGVSEKEILQSVSALGIDLASRKCRKLSQDEVDLLIRQIKPFRVVSAARSSDKVSPRSIESAMRKQGAVPSPTGLLLAFRTAEDASNCVGRLVQATRAELWTVESSN